MSSKAYLQGEARWAREQEQKDRAKAEDLRDPRWLNRERDRRAFKARRARFELREALHALRSLDDDRLPDTIAAAEKSAAQWRDLAESYEQRIAQSEDAQPTLEESA